ncbi:hypothetical protein V8E36_008824 [Tilletia maclaganii]
MAFNQFLDMRSEDHPIQGRREGHMPLTPLRNGLLWVGMITVGTGSEPARLTANFDTGSLDTMLSSPQYESTQSRTAHHTGETFQTEYLDGTIAEGTVVLDTVSVAGLLARDAAIGITTASFVPANDFQALVGMASMMPLCLSALRRPGLIPSLGTLHLSIGVRYFGLQQSFPSLGECMWTCSFSISGVAQVQSALVDTGTSLIFGPYRLVADIITAAGMSIHFDDGHLYGVYHTDGPTPSVSISIAGLNVVLSAESLAFRIRGPLTVAAIAGSDGLNGWWVLGDTFLQNVYAVFDAEEQRMGFAPH